MSSSTPLPFHETATGIAVIAAWRARGWSVIDTDYDLCFLSYPPTLGGAFDPMPYRLKDLGIVNLECTLSAHDAGYRAVIELFGVDGGCDRHRSSTVTEDVSVDSMPEIIAQAESTARETDRDELSSCFLFGDCAIRLAQ
ncbi:hypothetical protein [Actinokineospora sp. NPDC004072]